jgi:Domain of unknown function (DUF1932)
MPPGTPPAPRPGNDRRRADEMAQVAETLREIGIDPEMAEATESTLR